MARARANTEALRGPPVKGFGLPSRPLDRGDGRGFS